MGSQRRTFLEVTRVSLAYRRRLARVRLRLEAWERTLPPGPRARLLLGNPQALDDHLVLFIDFCHRTGVPSYVPKHCLLGIMLERRTLRGQLMRSWEAIRSWEAKNFWEPRRPFTKELVEHVFLTGLELSLASLGALRELYGLVGTLLVFGFYGLLRPGEWLNAQVRDLMFVEDVPGELIVILAIRDPKTRAWLGRAQFATIRHGPAGRWIRWFVQGKRPTDQIWPGSP